MVLGVEGLDYPTAIAGVPRLVSGAGTGDPPPPCLLITQSLAFSTVTLAVAGDVVVSRALRASQHIAAVIRRISTPALHCDVEVRCSNQLSYRGGFSLSSYAGTG